MISLVVCSLSTEMFDALAQNVEHTIGVPHEIIRIDNRQNQYSIGQAYNEGVKKARGNLVCFVHEDVRFLYPNWGSLLTRIFTDNTIGMLGVAGATYYPLPPIGWFSTNEAEVYLRQHFNQSAGEVKDLAITRFPGKLLVEAVVADGVFMVMPKHVFLRVSFDESTLPRFHGYDVDISLQVKKHYKIMLSKEIFIEHFSEGKKNADWHLAMHAISRKWQDALPRYTSNFTKRQKYEADILALDVYLRNRLNSNEGFAPRLFRMFYFANRQALVWAAIKVVLRYLLKNRDNR